MEKNLKIILILGTTFLVTLSSIFVMSSLFSSKEKDFQFPDFRFESINVNGETTADILSNDNSPLSAFNQPIFQINNVQELRGIRFNNPIQNKTHNEIKFDFFWNGEIFDILQGMEISDLEALTYTDYNLPFTPETKKINDYRYTNHENYEQEIQLNLEDHDFYLSYYGLTFTNQAGSKEYIQNGSFGGSSSRFKLGYSRDFHVWREAEEIDYGVGVFSGVSSMNTQSDGLGDYYLTPNFPYDELKDNFKNKLFSQDNVVFSIVDEGIKMNLTVEIEEDFDYQYVDISHVQITGVHKNNENQLNFFIANFSSFGKNERLVLSPRSLPYSSLGQTFTNDYYYDTVSPLKINDNNDITFAFYKNLHHLTALSNGWRSKLQQVYLIYSNDPNQTYFSNLNFNEVNMVDVLNDAILSSRNLSLGNLFSNQDKEDSKEILSQMKPLAIIDYSILPGEFYTYSSINLHYNGQVSTIDIQEPIFTTVDFVNLGISLSEESFLTVIPIYPSVPYYSDWDVTGSRYELSQIGISADNIRVQNLTSWKNMAQIAKDAQSRIKDNWNWRISFSESTILRDYDFWSLYLPFSYPLDKNYFGFHMFFLDENREVIYLESSFGINILMGMDYYDFVDDSTSLIDVEMNLLINVNELNIIFRIEIFILPD